jgi:transcription antitermination factor NusG
MNMAPIDSSLPQWFALRTRSRHEKMVRDRLHGNGFESFLPLMKTLRRWSDRKTWAELPLFAGYCFARFPLQARFDVLNTPGIVDIVGISRPEPIPTDEIEALQRTNASQRACNPHDYLVEGAWVEVVSGPLMGIRGQLVRKSGQDCIVIRVQLLQQAAAVHIDVGEVIPLQQTYH